MSRGHFKSVLNNSNNLGVERALLSPESGFPWLMHFFLLSSSLSLPLMPLCSCHPLSHTTPFTVPQDWLCSGIGADRGVMEICPRAMPALHGGGRQTAFPCPHSISDGVFTTLPTQRCPCFRTFLKVLVIPVLPGGECVFGPQQPPHARDPSWLLQHHIWQNKHHQKSLPGGGLTLLKMGGLKPPRHRDEPTPASPCAPASPLPLFSTLNFLTSLKQLLRGGLQVKGGGTQHNPCGGTGLWQQDPNAWAQHLGWHHPLTLRSGFWARGSL